VEGVGEGVGGAGEELSKLVQSRQPHRAAVGAIIDRLINNAILDAKNGTVRIARHSRAGLLARRLPWQALEHRTTERLGDERKLKLLGN
jgi:hypothetical protein